MYKPANYILPAVIALISIASCTSSRLTAEEKVAQREAQKTQIESALACMHFKVTMREMTTQRGPSHIITSDYNITVRGDTLESYLPYFGEVYSPSIESTQAEHTDRISACQIYRNDKHKYTQLNMLVKRADENYTYRLTVSDDGSASLYVSSWRRSSIEYEGDIDL